MDKIQEAYRQKKAELAEMRVQADRLGIELEEAAKPLLRNASELLTEYMLRLRSGCLPQLCRLGDDLDGIEVGCGLISAVGAPPGAGKTALASQIMFEALEHDRDLVAYVVNAEMSFDALIRRELTRLTRLKSDWIRFGNLTEADHQKIDEAAAEIAAKVDRLQVSPDPSGIEPLADLLHQPPGLVVVDYLQKFSPSNLDARSGVNAVMALLRRLASHGHAVLALSATKRDAKGKHSSGELDLSAFRESGEIEYNSDSAYVLADQGPREEGCEYVRLVTLGHVKNRHGAKVDRQLVFDMPAMRFERFEEPLATHAEFDEWNNGGFEFGGEG